MRHAWMLILVLVGVGLTACNPTTSATDAAAPDGFIELHDSGPVTDANTDVGPARDAAPPSDANIERYDGGMNVSCTGLAPVTPSGYCAAFADTYVAQLTRCGLLGTNGATELHAAFLDGCDVSAIEAAIAATHASWDANMAACCLAHSAGDTSCFLNAGSGVDECDFLHGTLANGATCATSVECMNGYCHHEDSCMGTCTAYAATGTVCNLGDVSCAPDADCDSTTHKCTTATGTAGMACSQSMNTGCIPTLTCLDPDGDGNGTCTALPSRGQTCTSDTILCDLNSAICDYDYTTMNGYCVPAATLDPARCIIDAQCTGDSYCRGASFGTGTYGTCTARAHRGASCATDKCVNGLTCRPDHTCGDAPAIGETCTPASGCADGLCAGSGMCVARYAGGQHCTLNNQCASGNCRVTTATCSPACP